MRRGILLATATFGVAACSHEPMDYIPANERTLLKAQARIGESGGGSNAISVQEMLERARSNANHPVQDRRLVVQFTGDAVALDDAQRKAVDTFGAAAGNTPLIVTGQRGGFQSGNPLLGQRRAVAVARVLSDRAPNVDVRFAADMPDNVVTVSAGDASRESAQP